MPVYATLTLIIFLASMGLPLLNGFIGEFMILQGAFAANQVWAYWAVSGIVLGAAYLLWLYQRVFWGQITNEENQHLHRPERARAGDARARWSSSASGSASTRSRSWTSCTRPMAQLAAQIQPEKFWARTPSTPRRAAPVPERSGDGWWCSRRAGAVAPMAPPERTRVRGRDAVAGFALS